MQILKVHFLDILPPFVLGLSDSSYNPGGEYVGVGWCIMTADDIDGDGIPKRQVWAEACARSWGVSSTLIEMPAHHCVVAAVDRIIKNIDVNVECPVNSMEPLVPKGNVWQELATRLPSMTQATVINSESEDELEIDEGGEFDNGSDSYSIASISFNVSSDSDLHSLSEKRGSDFHLLSDCECAGPVCCQPLPCWPQWQES